MTVKLKFTATVSLRVYRGRPAWNDGNIREVEEGEATVLVARFPDNFVVVKEEKPKAKKASPGPTHDKAIKYPGVRKGRK